MRAVQADLGQNHGRSVAASCIQNAAEWVGATAIVKEKHWEYALSALDAPIATVVVSLDRAMIAMTDAAGYREAMVWPSRSMTTKASASTDSTLLPSRARQAGVPTGPGARDPACQTAFS